MGNSTITELILKLLDKGFAVMVATLCLFIIYKLIKDIFPVFAQIKLLAQSLIDYQHENINIIKTNTEALTKNCNALDRVEKKL